MTLETRLRQVWQIALMEARRTFFSKRSFWVYLLALFPSVIFIGHGIEVKVREQRWSSRQVTPAANLNWVERGDTEAEVLRRAGPPLQDHDWESRRRGPNDRDDDEPSIIVQHRNLMYFDGKQRHNFFFENRVLTSKSVRPLIDFEEDRSVFAGVFQYFYLRLAIFFGCLGIFMNLFRGEMLDKTLHYWLLLPVRREVLLFGKYLSGVIASTVIFTTGAMLCFVALMWPQDPAEVSAFWNVAGPEHLLRYAAAAAMASAGYGSVFLAAGMLIRNPIVPAAVLLLWESINGFLPEILQKFSVLYYAQSICPVPAPTDPEMPALLKLLLSPAEPASALVSVLGLTALTALVLWAASRAVHNLEINYGGD